MSSICPAYEKLSPSVGGIIIQPPKRGGNLDEERYFWLALDFLLEI